MDLGPDYVQLAWGTADGENTIGRSAPSLGEATIRIAGKILSTRANQITVGDWSPIRITNIPSRLRGKCWDKEKCERGRPSLDGWSSS